MTMMSLYYYLTLALHYSKLELTQLKEFNIERYILIKQREINVSLWEREENLNYDTISLQSGCHAVIHANQSQ